MAELRSEDELQRAHDLLVAIILREVVVDVRAEDRLALQSACDVLCWMLGHDHNTAFAENLAKLQVALAMRGVVLRPRTERI